MRNILLVIVVLSYFISCQQKQKKSSENFTPQFDWLLGDWQRTNDLEGEQTYEHWKKSHDSLYSVHGYTLSGTDTVWQEWGQISRINNDWYFQAKLKLDTAYVLFLITEMTDTSFVCQNPEIEFPKIVKYFMHPEGLSAEVSAGDIKLPFEFVKIK